MGKKVLVFLLLLSFIGWTKAQQEELQNGTEQSKQLQVFGRNIFASRNLSFEPNLNIPTPENYRLGPGDEVIIDVWELRKIRYERLFLRKVISWWRISVLST